MEKPSFYLVWVEDTEKVTYKHISFDSAQIEAERLIRAHGAAKVHVMACVATAVKRDIDWDLLPSDRDIPF